jgi:hypothetical protein
MRGQLPPPTDAPNLDTTGIVLRILQHDLKELELIMGAEMERCSRTVHRVVSDEISRALRVKQWALDSLGMVNPYPLPSVDKMHAVAMSEHDDPLRSDQPPFSAATFAFARIGKVVAVQRARLSVLLGSYLHWRCPLLFWWAWTTAADALKPFSPLLAPFARLLAPALVPTLRGIAAAASRAQAGRDAVAGLAIDLQVSRWVGAPRPPPSARRAPPPPPMKAQSHSQRHPLHLRLPHRVQVALIHLIPQIVAKIRHATFHEPAALGTFLVVIVRLLVMVPMLTLCRLGGRYFEPSRQALLRSVLREAMLASERCNRVERRRSLPPLAPRGGWRTSVGLEALALAAAAASNGVRALEQLQLTLNTPSTQARSRVARIRSFSVRRWLVDARRPRLRVASHEAVEHAAVTASGLQSRACWWTRAKGA